MFWEEALEGVGHENVATRHFRNRAIFRFFFLPFPPPRHATMNSEGGRDGSVVSHPVGSPSYIPDSHLDSSNYFSLTVGSWTSTPSPRVRHCVSATIRPRMFVVEIRASTDVVL